MAPEMLQKFAEEVVNGKKNETSKVGLNCDFYALGVLLLEFIDSEMIMYANYSTEMKG